MKVVVEYISFTPALANALNKLIAKSETNLTVGNNYFEMELSKEEARNFYRSIQTKNKHVRKSMEHETNFDYLISL